MKLGRIALLLAGATALEFFFGGTKYRGVWPVDWLLVATAIVARSGGFGRAVLTGAGAGFIEDALTETLLGLNAFAKAAIGYLLAFVSVRVVLGGALAVGGVIALCSLANDAIVAVLRSLLLGSPVVLGAPEALWRAVATGTTAGVFEATWSFPWREWRERRRQGKLR
ncbi:MAG TPA: rod shape-determining protein MreD [Thermoanaerobaculia bacterium]